MLPEAKKKKVDSNPWRENTTLNFNTSNYSEQSINTYNTSDKS